MLEPLSNDLESTIRNAFNDNYWLLRILINDLYMNTGISTDYFAELILSYDKGEYFTERDPCTGQMLLNEDTLRNMIISTMKREKVPEIKAKGYLLSLGWCGLENMTSIEEEGVLYCYPKGLAPLKPNLKEIEWEVFLTFKDGQRLYVMANNGANILKNRHSYKNISQEGDLPLAN